MNKKLISIWMLAFCTSVGTSIQVAATEEKDFQTLAVDAQKEDHLRIEISVKDDNGKEKPIQDMKEDIKALQENRIFILERKPKNPLLIVKEEGLRAAIMGALNKPFNEGDVSQELKGLNNKKNRGNFIKIINNVLKETGYQWNGKISELKNGNSEYKDLDKLSSLKLEMDKGSHDATYRILLEKRPLITWEMVGWFALFAVVCIVIYCLVSFVWGDKKETEQGKEQKDKPKKRKKKGKINS